MQTGQKFTTSKKKKIENLPNLSSPLNSCHAEQIKMSHPLLISSNLITVCVCVVDGVRGRGGAVIILVILWGKIKDWVSLYLLHLTFPKTNNYLSLRQWPCMKPVRYLVISYNMNLITMLINTSFQRKQKYLWHTLNTYGNMVQTRHLSTFKDLVWPWKGGYGHANQKSVHVPTIYVLRPCMTLKIRSRSQQYSYV